MSTFNTPWFSSDESFFNKLNISRNRHVIVSGETEDFSQVTDQWQTNGFIVHNVPFRDSFTELIQRIHQTGEEIAIGDSYALVGMSPPVLLG